MTDKPNNPQAYPLLIEGPTPQNGHQQDYHEGMTLRDYFAGQVDVSAYRPAETFKDANGRAPTGGELAEFIAKIRMVEADAMLKERAK